MTIVITSAMALGILYIAAAMIARLHDCWVQCRHYHRTTAPMAPKPVATDYQGDITKVELAPAPKPTTPQNPIETMNIRQLKKAASQARIKGYSNMRKAQLIAALT